MNYRSETTSDMNGQIVDLSRLMDKLAAYEDVSDDLTEQEEQKLVQYVKACAEMSHSKIQKRYDHWLETDRAHDVAPRAGAAGDGALVGVRGGDYATRGAGAAGAAVQGRAARG